MIFVSDFNRSRFISAILAVSSSRMILWILWLLLITIMDFKVNTWMERRMSREHGCGKSFCCCCCERALTKKVDYSTLVLQRRKKKGRLPVSYRVTFLLTLPFSPMEQLVISCASFDRMIKTFLFDSFLSDSFARRALWQDGLGKLIFPVFS